MKKILVVFLVMIAFASNAIAANPNEYDAFSKLYNKSNFKALVRYLEADKEQVNQLSNIFSVSNDKLKTALKTQNEIEADNAVWYGLSNARNILTTKQYNKVMAVLYVSISSKEQPLLSEK
jgi:hypothetical protein